MVRSAEGSFLAGLCKKFKISEPSSTEAIASLVAIDFVMGLPFHKIIFEEDTLLVINLIGNKSSSLGSYGHVVYDIKRALFSLPYKWSFIRRKKNKVAHCLTRQASLVSDSQC